MPVIPRDPALIPPSEVAEAPTHSRHQVYTRYKLPRQDDCCNEVIAKLEMTEQTKVKNIGHDMGAIALNTNSLENEEQQRRHQSVENHGHRPRPRINEKIPPPSSSFDITSPPTQSSSADLQLLESCILKCFPNASQRPHSFSPPTPPVGDIETLHALPRPLSGTHDFRPFLRSSGEVERSVSSLGSSYDSNTGYSSGSLLSLTIRHGDLSSSDKGYPTLRSVITGQSSLVTRHRYRHFYSRRKSSRRDGRLVDRPFNSPSSQQPSRVTPGAILSTATALFTRSQSSLMRLYLNQNSPTFSATSLGSRSGSESSRIRLDTGVDTDMENMASGCPYHTANECDCASGRINHNITRRNSPTQGDGTARQSFEQQLLGGAQHSEFSAGTPTSPNSFSSTWPPTTATPVLRKDRQGAFSIQLLSSPILSSLPSPPPPPKPFFGLSFSLKSEKAYQKRLSEVTTATQLKATAALPSSQRPIAQPLRKSRHFSFFQNRPSLYEITSSSQSENHVNSIAYESQGNRYGKRVNGFMQLDDDEDSIHEIGRTSSQDVHVRGGSPLGSPMQGEKTQRQGLPSASPSTTTAEKNYSSADHRLSSDRKRPSLIASWTRVMTSWSSVSLHLHTKNISSRPTGNILRELGTSSTGHGSTETTRLCATPTGGSPPTWIPNEERDFSLTEPALPGTFDIQRSKPMQTTPTQSSSALQQRDGSQSNDLSDHVFSIPPGEKTGRTNCNCHRNGSVTVRPSCLLHKELPNLPSNTPAPSIAVIAPSPALDIQPRSIDGALANKKYRGSAFFTAALSSLTSAVGGTGKDNCSKQATNISGQIDIHNRSKRQSIMSFAGSRRSSRRPSAVTVTPASKGQNPISSQGTLLQSVPTTLAVYTPSSSDEKKQGKTPSAVVLRIAERHASGQAVCPTPATPCFSHARSRGLFDTPGEESIPSSARLAQPRRSVLQQRLYQNPQLNSSPQLPSVKESLSLSSISLPTPVLASPSYSHLDLRLGRCDEESRSQVPNEHAPKSEKSNMVPRSSIADIDERREYSSTMTTTPLTSETSGGATRCEKEMIPFFEPFHVNGRRGSGYVSFHFDLSHLEECDREQAHFGAELGSKTSATSFKKPTRPNPTAMADKTTPPVPLFYRVFQRPSFLSSMPTLTMSSLSPHSIEVPSFNSDMDSSLTASPINLPTGALRPPPLQPRPKVPPLKFSLKMPQLLPKPLLSPEFLSSIQTSLKGQSQDFFYGQTSSSCSVIPESRDIEIDFGPERVINGNKVSSSVDTSSATAFAVLPRKHDIGSADIISSSPSSIASAVDSITRLNLIGVSDKCRPRIPLSRHNRGSPPPPPLRRFVQRVRSAVEGSEEESEGDDGDDGDNRDDTDEASDEVTDPFRTLQEHLDNQQQQQQSQNLDSRRHPLRLQGQQNDFTASHLQQLQQEQQKQPLTPLRFKDRILRGRRSHRDDGGASASERGLSTVSLPEILSSISSPSHSGQSPMSDSQDLSGDRRSKWGWARMWKKS